MQALVCKQYGSTDDLVIEEWARPEPGPDQLQIDIAAAGINFPDILSIAGQYQDKTPPPFVPGGEVAGTVAAIGADVTRFTVGDAVIALPSGGGFAEVCVADESMVMTRPAAVSFVQGAGFSITYGTSYHALKQSADLQAGETILVLGAAGGVGIAAVEIAKTMGATVIAAANGADKLAFAAESGADELIDYGKESLRDAIKTLTDGNGVDVVYDPVGGELALQALRSLAWQGRYLVIGFASGDIPKMPANIALLKEASIIGVWWGTWAKKNPALQAENVRDLGAMIEGGKLRMHVSRIFPLAEYRDAFRAISERRALGKVVLTFGDN